MAAALDTEPVLIVAREADRRRGRAPLPVDTAGIPNDHLQYAITWFALAVVWAGMTLLCSGVSGGGTSEGTGDALHLDPGAAPRCSASRRRC